MSRLKIIELDNKASHVITQRVKARSLKWRWWIKICFPKDGILTDNSSLLSLYGVNMVKTASFSSVPSRHFCNMHFGLAVNVS